MARKGFLISFAIWMALAAQSSAFAYTTSQIESVTTPEETQINGIREQEISQLKIVLGRRFAESRRPDILLRLAELYIERYRFYFFKENQIHQELYKKGVKERYVNHERSRAELRASTGACHAILKSGVDYPKMDQVYYFLGYNAQEIGQPKEALRYFKVVIERYPHSTYAAEAYRNLAEADFEVRNYSGAVKYYEKAAEYTKVPSYPRTLYKLAWSYFKTRRRSEALATMKKVIEVTGADEKFVGLKEESLSDIVTFYAEVGKSREAHDYFADISGGTDIYVKALEKLSGVYEKRGDYRLALKTNEGLIAEYGDKRPDLIYDLLGKNVELYRKAGDAKGEERSLNRLVQYFVDHRKDVSKGDDALATFLRAKSYLRGRATEIHKEARFHGDLKKYSRAADLYDLYIRAFLSKPDSEKEQRELSEIRVYRSDCLLAAGREQEAMPLLELTFKEEGDPKQRKEAGATLLNILIRKLDAARAKNKPVDDLEKQFVATSNYYMKEFPNDGMTVELRYKSARLAVARSGPEGLSSEARDALSELVEKFPNRPESVEAAHDLVADTVKRKKPSKAVELARQYLANKPLMTADKKKELVKYLRTIESRQEFSSVQEIEKDKDYAKAAAEYEKLAAEGGDDQEVSSKALNNAVINFEKTAKYDDAVRVLLLMYAKNPKNPFPREELKHIASMLLWKSEFDEAAKVYAKLGGLSKIYEPDERFSFVRTAFWLHWGLGDLAAAYLVGGQAEREMCPKSSSESCHELAMDLGRLLIEAGRQQEAIDFYKHYLYRDSAAQRRAEAAFTLGSLYQQQHDARKALTYYEEATRSVSHEQAGARKGRHAHGADTQRERSFAAHAAFLLVEPHFAQFQALRLDQSEKKMKSVTRQKLSRLDDLVTRYLDVVNYGDGEWGIAAFERLYDAFSSFAAELDAAPMPKLDAAKAEEYRRAIRQVTEPMVNRASEYLRSGLLNGLKLDVTTSTFVALTQRLSRHWPREFPPAHYVLAGERHDSVSVLKLLGNVPGKFQDDDAKDLRKTGHEWREQVAEKLSQNPKASDNWVELGNIEALSGRSKLARLLYEQALTLNPKNFVAISNLSFMLFLENRTIEAVKGFEKAANLADSNRDVRLNLARLLLAFHHFKPASDSLRGLAARFPDDKEIAEANAASMLGAGQIPQAGVALAKLDAKSGKSFSLWYNWSVWALLAGDKDKREKALDLLKDREKDQAPLEKSQVDLAIGVFGGAK